MTPRCTFTDPKRGRCVAEDGHNLSAYDRDHRFGHLDIHFRTAVLGGHTHVAVFAGPDEEHRAKLGDLTFRNEEWDLLEPRIGGLTTDGHVSTLVSRPLT